MAQSLMVLNSVKKHSVRYDAHPDDDNPVMTSAYISKSALPTPFPKDVLITVTTQGED
jgi:hypothetical protein